MPVLCLLCVGIFLLQSLGDFGAIGLLVVLCVGSVLLALCQLSWPFNVFLLCGSDRTIVGF